jgi:hypothetical protein
MVNAVTSDTMLLQPSHATALDALSSPVSRHILFSRKFSSRVPLDVPQTISEEVREGDGCSTERESTVCNSSGSSKGASGLSLGADVAGGEEGEAQEASVVLPVLEPELLVKLGMSSQLQQDRGLVEAASVAFATTLAHSSVTSGSTGSRTTSESSWGSAGEKAGDAAAAHRMVGLSSQVSCWPGSFSTGVVGSSLREGLPTAPRAMHIYKATSPYTN